MIVDRFDAFRIYKEESGISGRVEQIGLDDLTPGEVVIRTAYSGVNYKDALAATGAGKIIRSFPLVGGVDVAGSVVTSQDDRWEPGDEVLVTGYDLGVAQDGGFAAYVRVPADWVVPLPDGLTSREAMTIGTAGFTAALSVAQLEHNGLTPSAGPVIVTAATGGVGSMAIELLAGLGYEVTALTGKDDEHDYLRSLGATAILSRHEIDLERRPLEKETWAGAVDPAGGAILAWLLPAMRYGASVACSGLTAGFAVKTTVMPFILRGVSLLGIDSVACPMPHRLDTWRRLATDLKPAHLDTIAREIALADLPTAFETLLQGNARGRFVVRVE